MSISRLITLTTLIAVSLTSQFAWAISHYQEQRYARQLMQTVTTGKALMLKSGASDFLTIDTPSNTPRPRGGVILLHDLGAHPDWPQVIRPLRTHLPDYGWESLSLQLPLLSNHPSAHEYKDLFQEAQTRIEAGIRFFKDKGILNIVLIGHGMGGVMGMNYLARDTSKGNQVIAFIGIAMYDHDLVDKGLATDKLIVKLKIPVLDIVGRLDRRVATKDAAARHRAAKQASLSNYHQVELSGADHFFDGLENTLIKRIRGWLNKQAPSMELNAETFVPGSKN